MSDRGGMIALLYVGLEQNEDAKDVLEGAKREVYYACRERTVMMMRVVVDGQEGSR